MLDNSGRIVLIDLGSVVKFGEPIRECTNYLYLDTPLDEALPIFDINCIASTLLMCGDPSHISGRQDTRSNLLDKYNSPDYRHPAIELACICLKSYSSEELSTKAAQWLANQPEEIKQIVKNL